MSQENQNVSRRRFLAAGSAVAVSTLLTMEAKAATEPVAPVLSDDPVTTEAVQRLSNKTISGLDGNVIGTDYINIREAPSFPTSGNDITAAINWAITKLSTSGTLGGQILIPRGVWTSDGGHYLQDAISIEGVGFSLNTLRGTEIQIKSTSSNTSMFIMTGTRRNCSLKNMLINMYNKPSGGIGLLIQNAGGVSVYETSVENVCFASGAYGIKVDSTSGQFECILNKFDRVSFLLCRTGFYCNSINGGYSFDNCYFVVPTAAGGYASGTALDIQTMGNLTLEHCLFVGNYPSQPQVPPTDGTTILKTVGTFNSISFIDCQDENLEYAYQNSTNYFPDVPLVYRNCLLQSKLKFTAAGSVVFDSCRLNGTLLSDTSTAFVRVLRQGLTNVYNTTPANQIANFVNKNSYVIDEYGDFYSLAATTSGITEVNASRGEVVIPSGASYVQVYNLFVRTYSLIFTQLKTFDSGGARVAFVDCQNGYFIIYLTQNAATNLKVAFKLEATA